VYCKHIVNKYKLCCVSQQSIVYYNHSKRKTERDTEKRIGWEPPNTGAILKPGEAGMKRAKGNDITKMPPRAHLLVVVAVTFNRTANGLKKEKRTEG
jgi:hypothetical protein